MAVEAAEAQAQVAIMFTDMVVSSPRARRDEALAQVLREEYGQLVRSLLGCHGGREIKTLEDGFLLEFEDGLPAVSFGLALQAALAARNQCVPEERRVELRIGVHLGQVVHRDGDVFGEGVNLAARIEALARPGSLYISEAVAQQVGTRLATPPVRLGRNELKNIRLPVDVYRLDPPGQRERHPLLDRVRSLLR
ncbi:adenylate/guanylate cyclase domain-containing protein [Myxococcaceae bacterium GXIMD 01537]